MWKPKFRLTKGVETVVELHYNDGRDVSNGGNKPLSICHCGWYAGLETSAQLEDWSFYISRGYTGRKRADSTTAKRAGWVRGLGYRRGMAGDENVKLRAGVLNVGDKDLKRDDYVFRRRTSLLYGGGLPFLTRLATAAFCRCRQNVLHQPMRHDGAPATKSLAEWRLTHRYKRPYARLFFTRHLPTGTPAIAAPRHS